MIGMVSNVRTLIRAGSNPYLTDQHDHTALAVAKDAVTRRAITMTSSDLVGLDLEAENDDETPTTRTSVIRSLVLNDPSGIDSILRTRMTIRSETCLHSAANECDIVLGRALLQRGAKIFARDASGFTAFHTLAAACASSSSESSQWTEFASMLVEKDKRILSARSSNGCTPLQIFVKSQSGQKNLKFLKYLLQESRDLVSWCDNIGRNVIHDAARRGVKEVMALIIDNINRKDLLYRKSSRERWNALHFSVRCGKVEMARFLTMYDIETEKLANARDRSGRTPLFLASSDSMRVALKKNLWSAALNGSVEDLRTALREFKFGGRREDQSTDLGPATRLALQTCLGPLSVTIRQNQTASHLAVLGKSKHVRQKLILLKECDESCVDLKDANGRTPLMIISRKGNLQAVKCLVRFQCDLNACDKRGNTALHYASA